MPQSAVLAAPRELRLEERPRVPLAPGEARVRVRRAGVCGTDVAIWSGAYRVPLPLVLGHEWAGEVAEVARADDERWLGRRVTAEINRHCAARGEAAACPLCARGLPTHCATRTVTGIAGADGAFAEEIVVPAGTLVALPESLDDDAAVLVEPFAAALQAFALSPVKGGDLVVVLGAGRLGALAALVAERLGARVVAVGRERTRQRLAPLGVAVEVAEIGSRVAPDDPLAPAPSALLERVRALSGGCGADLVVEATGSAEGLATALDLVRPRGTIALKSTPGQPVARFDLTRAVVNEVRLQGSRCGSFAAALEFLQRHPLPLDALIEASFPLAEAGPALEEAARGGKFVLECG
ncbi:MAG: alcohol dehydrogenase catalytic domain-containing protein [Acidobacteria bacterium]|nr:alcohol dehydrogenase catalytic domain-containing protein [Acidobacteriota bacterium]